jgi:hypothetical protein
MLYNFNKKIDSSPSNTVLLGLWRIPVPFRVVFKKLLESDLHAVENTAADYL